METVYIPDAEFVTTVKALSKEGEARMHAIGTHMRWVVTKVGEAPYIIRPESTK